MHKPMNKLIINTMKMRNTKLSQEVCQIKNKYGFGCSFMFSRCIYVITYQFTKFSLCEKQRIYSCVVDARTMENVKSNEFISPIRIAMECAPLNINGSFVSFRVRRVLFKFKFDAVFSLGSKLITLYYVCMGLLL